MSIAVGNPWDGNPATSQIVPLASIVQPRASVSSDGDEDAAVGNGERVTLVAGTVASAAISLPGNLTQLVKADCCTNGSLGLMGKPPRPVTTKELANGWLPGLQR